MAGETEKCPVIIGHQPLFRALFVSPPMVP